jgi:hypothetical protein
MDEIEAVQRRIYERVRNGVTLNVDFDPDAIRLAQLNDERQLAQGEIDRINEIIRGRQVQGDAIEANRQRLMGEKLDLELNQITQENIKNSATVDWLRENGDLMREEALLLDRMGELAASILVMYAFLNEISVVKTCPGSAQNAEQTLNPLTCECCNNCLGGKVFPDPMRGCDCECPQGKEPCFSLGSENCYDPCGAGQIRVGSDCHCSCVDGSKELCGDQCYDPCTNGKIRNTSTCGCDCPAGKEPCGNGCYDPCPPDHTMEW